LNDGSMKNDWQHEIFWCPLLTTDLIMIR
jgi:hypothetical protein